MEMPKNRVRKANTNLVREPVNTTTPEPVDNAEALCLGACGPRLSETSRKVILFSADVIDGWIAEGIDLHSVIIPVLRERTDQPSDRVIRSWAYFTEAVKARHALTARLADRRKDAEKRSERSPAAAPDDPLQRLADWIISDKFVPPSAVTNVSRDALLARGLVTPARLRARQIY